MCFEFVVVAVVDIVVVVVVAVVDIVVVAVVVVADIDIVAAAGGAPENSIQREHYNSSKSRFQVVLRISIQE